MCPASTEPPTALPQHQTPNHRRPSAEPGEGNFVGFCDVWGRLKKVVKSRGRQVVEEANGEWRMANGEASPSAIRRMGTKEILGCAHYSPLTNRQGRICAHLAIRPIPIRANTRTKLVVILAKCAAFPPRTRKLGGNEKMCRRLKIFRKRCPAPTFRRGAG